MAVRSTSAWRRRLILAGWGVVVFVVAWYGGRRVGGGGARSMTRIYDVRDLLMNVPEFDGVPHLGIGAAWTEDKSKSAPPANLQTSTGKPGAARESHDAKIAEIIRIIRTAVEPRSWDAGAGSITDMRGRLVITQTPAAHERIQKLLRDLYASRQVQIVMEARFIWLDKEASLKLPPALRERLLGTQFDRPGDGVELTTSQANQLIRASSAAAFKKTNPLITLFNGQRAYLLTATQRVYVQELNESAAADGKTNRTTKMDVAASGVLLDVRATASSDHQWVTLSLHSEAADLLSIQSAAAAASKEWPKVQDPVMDFTALETTVRVRDGGAFLLGGFTLSDRAATLGTTRPVHPSRRLFLLMKPKVMLPETDSNANVFPRPSP